MSFSYRLKKKELVLLLDLAGDVNSLEQKFGDIYISRDEHEKTVLELQKKGMLTVSGDCVIPESRVGFVTDRFYDSELVIADEKLETWLYCSEDIITAVSTGGIFVSEYIITPLVSDEDKKEYFSDLCDRKFSVLRGENRDLIKFTGEYIHE